MASEMREFRWRRLARPLGATLLFASGLFAAAPASAGDFDSAFGSVLSFWGVQNERSKDGIDYTPRAPLVVPPTQDLPPPQDKSARRADWPTDPDTLARRKAEADSRRPAPRVDTPQPADAAPMKVQMTDCPTTGACGEDSFWDKVKATFTFGQQKDAVLSAAEPNRDYLIEPPTGYRRPVPMTTPQPTPQQPKKEANAATTQPADATVKPQDTPPAQPAPPLAQKDHWGLW